MSSWTISRFFPPARPAVPATPGPGQIGRCLRLCRTETADGQEVPEVNRATNQIRLLTAGSHRVSQKGKRRPFASSKFSTFLVFNLPSCYLLQSNVEATSLLSVPICNRLCPPSLSLKFSFCSPASQNAAAPIITFS